MCRKCRDEMAWIGGYFVLSHDFQFYEGIFTRKVLSKAKKTAEKRVFVNDPTVKALRAKIFRFSEECMGLLCDDFAEAVNREMLFFGFPLHNHKIYSGFCLYRLGRIVRGFDFCREELKPSNIGEELNGLIHQIILGQVA